jgi:hypothetical protein
MEKGVNEKDWKLFRSRLPGWQETYMERIVEEYMELLGSEDQASEKFWALDERIKKDKRNPGVLLQDVKRSNMYIHLLQLLRYEVILLENLDGFSEELQEKLTWDYKK